MLTRHYRKNKDRHNQRRYINQLRYKAENREKLLQYLAAHGCVDCVSQTRAFWNSITFARRSPETLA